jgi:hypothetical protein
MALRLPFPLGIVLVLTGVTSCASQEQRTAEAVRGARSWTATVRLTSDALRRGVPRLYARQVLQAAEDPELGASRGFEAGQPLSIAKDLPGI